MKDLPNFREECNLDEMTWNELQFYSEILPILKKFVTKTNLNISNWTPKFYFGFYGFNEGSCLLFKTSSKTNQKSHISNSYF